LANQQQRNNPLRTDRELGQAIYLERIHSENCICEGVAALETTAYRICCSFLRKEREVLNRKVIKNIESSETQKSSPSGNIEVKMSSNISIWNLFFRSKICKILTFSKRFSRFVADLVFAIVLPFLKLSFQFLSFHSIIDWCPCFRT